MNYFPLKNNFMKSHTMLSSNTTYADPPSTSSVRVESDSVTASDKKIQEVWSKYNFNTDKVKVENISTLNHIKTTWNTDLTSSEIIEEEPRTPPPNQHKEEEITPSSSETSQNVIQSEQSSPEKEEEAETSPSYYARRPPNAFLIFCKKHRSIVRDKYPTTENRGVTKVLGEWWATLDMSEKKPYTDLAKDYKEAFLSANPDFRWYKLPAPPLRTLSTRPSTITKPTTPIHSPQTAFMSEFNPGKLADESQLGGLTSLMTNNNYSPSKGGAELNCCNVEHNNNSTEYQPSNESIFYSNNVDQIKESPLNSTKKLFELNEDGTAQSELMGDYDSQQRKSDRMCKGKRYEQFMLEGKLLGNKPLTKLAQYHKFDSEIKTEQEFSIARLQTSPEPPKLDLEHTIKRLAERTNVKLDFDNEGFKINKPERARTVSETSDNDKNMIKTAKNLSAQLDIQIGNLPQMNYDEFVARKREGKKRKIKIKSDNYAEPKIKSPKIENQPVGSQKRKNKQNIIHLNTDIDGGTLRMNGALSTIASNNNNSNSSSTRVSSEMEGNGALIGDNALLGLETLALVAASTQKLNEDL